MAEPVLDASAVLAMIFGEPGSEYVAETLPGALISAVNLSEVISRLMATDMPGDTIETIIDMLQLSILPFDAEQAFLTAKIHTMTKSTDLSFADRACLAVGILKSAEVVTTNRAWKDVSPDTGVSITLIR